MRTLDLGLGLSCSRACCSRPSLLFSWSLSTPKATPLIVVSHLAPLCLPRFQCKYICPRHSSPALPHFLMVAYLARFGFKDYRVGRRGWADEKDCLRARQCGRHRRHQVSFSGQVCVSRSRLQCQNLGRLNLTPPQRWQSADSGAAAQCRCKSTVTRPDCVTVIQQVAERRSVGGEDRGCDGDCSLFPYTCEELVCLSTAFKRSIAERGEGGDLN